MKRILMLMIVVMLVGDLTEADAQFGSLQIKVGKWDGIEEVVNLTIDLSRRQLYSILPLPSDLSAQFPFLYVFLVWSFISYIDFGTDKLQTFSLCKYSLSLATFTVLFRMSKNAFDAFNHIPSKTMNVATFYLNF